MTPNHGYTPADDREREQSTPTDHQPPQQSQQSVQSMQQGQAPQQTAPQGQSPPQQRSATPQQGQPTQLSMQQGQPTPQRGQTPPQQGQALSQQGQTSPQSLEQGQPAAQQSQTTPQSMQQRQPTPQTMSKQQGQMPPSQQSARQPQPTQQSQRQPSQAMGQQQMQTAQPTQGPPGAQAQFRQSSGVQPQRQPQGRGPQEPLLKPIRVNQIITEDVVTAERDTPVRTVVAQMAENDVGSVVVVEDDRPIGIITDRKVALALEEMPDIAEQTADELLHGDVFTADPSMNIFDAIQVMSDEGIRRLPIVDDDGALRGIVTLDDALVLLGGVVSEVSDTVQSQSPRL